MPLNKGMTTSTRRERHLHTDVESLEEQLFLRMGNNQGIVTNHLSDDQEHESRAEQFLHLTSELSEGGERVLREPNAGGNSLLSEVLSFELMHVKYGATLEKTEMEINYHSDTKKVDYSMQVGGRKYGVSVTRAFHFVDDNLFTPKDVFRILEKKLEGLPIASKNVVRKDRWDTQVLHVWVRSFNVARLIQEVYPTFPEDLRRNTIVMLTTAPTVHCVFDELSGDIDEIFTARGIPKPVYIRTYEDDVFCDEDFCGMDQVEMDLEELMNNEFAFDSEDDGMGADENLVDFYSL